VTGLLTNVGDALDALLAGLGPAAPRDDAEAAAPRDIRGAGVVNLFLLVVAAAWAVGGAASLAVAGLGELRSEDGRATLAWLAVRAPAPWLATVAAAYLCRFHVQALACERIREARGVDVGFDLVGAAFDALGVELRAADVRVRDVPRGASEKRSRGVLRGHGWGERDPSGDRRSREANEPNGPP